MISEINSWNAKRKTLKAIRKPNSRPMIPNSCELDNSYLYSNCINLSTIRETQTSTKLLTVIRYALY